MTSKRKREQITITGYIIELGQYPEGEKLVANGAMILLVRDPKNAPNGVGVWYRRDRLGNVSGEKPAEITRLMEERQLPTRPADAIEGRR